MNTKNKPLTIKDWDSLDRPREKLKAVFELIKRGQQLSDKKEIIFHSSKSVFNYIAPDFFGLPHEEF